MKSVIARTLVSLLLGVWTLGPTVHAQSIERTIKATIPFEFSVGRQDLSCRQLLAGEHARPRFCNCATTPATPWPQC